MRADLWIAAFVLTALPGAAQRGVVNRVVVSAPTIRAGDTVKITASGTNPLSYQWKRNGADITGGTSAYRTAHGQARTEATETGSNITLDLIL